MAKALEIFEEHLRTGEPLFMVLSSPTGYGKSTMSLTLAAALRRPNPLGSRLIHVLPLRAIVSELYGKAVRAYGWEDRPDPCGRPVEEGEGLPPVARPTVGAQAMHFLDGEKTPFLTADLVFTTFDSFVYDLFRIPVGGGSHHEIPRYSIYSSVVVFDEAHLYAGEPAEEGEEAGGGKMLSAFLASISVSYTHLTLPTTERV